MADVPPPSAPTGPPGPLPAGARPPTVTSAGVIEIVLGALVLLLTLLTLTQIGNLDIPTWFYGLIALTVVQGVLEIVAGVQVLKLKKSGRILAIVMASIGIVFQLLSLSSAAGGTLILIMIGVALRVMVIVFLNQAPARQAFGV